jgi:hypothetical protein
VKKEKKEKELDFEEKSWEDDEEDLENVNLESVLEGIN